MTSKKRIYIPPRMAWQGKISGNPITQFEHSGRIEDVDVEDYSSRGVKGWTVRRPNGETILVTSKPTSANPYGAVLLMPGATSLSDGKQEASEESRWLYPKTKVIDESFNGIAISSQTRRSWTDTFAFIEEAYKDESLLRYGLRAPQLGAIYATLAHWKVTQDTGTIVMPTGTGKTETMVALLVREQPECLLVIVPTSALRDQIADKFLTFGLLQQFGVIGEGAMLPIVGRIEHQFESSDAATLFLGSCNVVIATMAVIGGCSDDIQQAIARGCSHLFIDEAHHAPASTWSTFREHVSKENKPILQFTATPFRRDGKHVGGKIIFNYPLKKAQEEHYFTPITFVSIWEYNREYADEAIAKRTIQALQDDRKNDYDHLVMARTDNIARAKKVHEIYYRLAPEFSPLIVHSEQNAEQRHHAVENLRERRSRIIVCVDMLGEGFDLPQLKIAALHDIHKSLAVTIQFAGRFTRTATGLGEATIIANAADADVEVALEDLYSKDADWNLVLRRLSEGATNKQSLHSDFIEGFQNVPQEVPLQNIYPKMSAVVYKTTCKDWSPDGVSKLLKNIDLLVKPTINSKERVLLFITREQTAVVWGKTKSIHDVVYNLYLAHWDEHQHLLFINSTNNGSVHSDLAKVLAGDDVEIIRGEQVYRVLSGINRLTLANLGLLHLLSRAAQFTMYVGTDIGEGLTPSSRMNRKKSNLFSRGYEGGESVTVGASHKGRVWSHRIAESISEWVLWCQRIGQKLLDDSISTDTILDHVIIPKIVDKRPKLIPLTIEWPHYFLSRSDEAVMVAIGDKSLPFYQVDLRISSFTDTGPLCFVVVIDGQEAQYEIIFEGKKVKYVPLSDKVIYLSVSNQRSTLTDWFQDEHPIITFDDTSKLEYNELSQPKRDREPYNPSKIQGWVWAGIDLTKESQYEKDAKNQQLLACPDSIQRYVIDQLLTDTDRDGRKYEIIFDDDDAGEIADIVALKVVNDSLFVHLFHCKYSHGPKAGIRVKDFYEVCGQAQKSIYWRSDIKGLFRRLNHRESARQNRYKVSRFERGDLQQLGDLERKSRVLVPKFHISIVQPGLDVQSVTEDILDLLGATELYLKETFDVSLTVIGSK